MTAAPSAPKRSPSSRILWLIAAALVAGLGAVVVLLQSVGAPVAGPDDRNGGSSNGNPATASDARIYRDHRVGFSVEYPSGWTATEVRNSGIMNNGFVFPFPLRWLDLNNRETGRSLQLGVRRLQESVTITPRIMFFPDVEGGEYITEPITSADGHDLAIAYLKRGDAIEEMYLADASAPMGELYVEDYVVFGEYRATGDKPLDLETDLALLKAIGSTLTFADAASRWRIYSNAHYGLQFLYPASWQAIEQSEDAIALGPASSTYYFEGAAEFPVVIGFSPKSPETYVGTVPASRTSPAEVNDNEGYRVTEPNGVDVSYILPLRAQSGSVVLSSPIHGLASANRLAAPETEALRSVFSDALASLVIADSLTDPALRYRNDALGFTLAFPVEWRGYRATQYLNVDPNTNAHTDYWLVSFEHPKETSSDGRPGKVGFWIYLFPNPTTVMPQGVHVIADGERGRYGYSKSNAAVPGELEALWNQMDAIRDSFTAL